MRAGGIDRRGPVADVRRPGAFLGHDLDGGDPSARIGKGGGTWVTQPGDTEGDDAHHDEGHSQPASLPGTGSLRELLVVPHHSDATHPLSIGRRIGDSTYAGTPARSSSV